MAMPFQTKLSEDKSNYPHRWPGHFAVLRPSDKCIENVLLPAGERIIIPTGGTASWRNSNGQCQRLVFQAAVVQDSTLI